VECGTTKYRGFKNDIMKISGDTFSVNEETEKKSSLFYTTRLSDSVETIQKQTSMTSKKTESRYEDRLPA